ncbi:hypothetical protein VP01_2887g4 [Puccinia sorghi]|uniref:Uncharacterized protein n=1 Tax=Puccinia sorghi TaxID=27349 RepID=A0A0L6V3I3_9BASI|nr:hypothetical protein VP01_2887g4 [Puccinia sorghi]
MPHPKLINNRNRPGWGGAFSQDHCQHTGDTKNKDITPSNPPNSPAFAFETWAKHFATYAGHPSPINWPSSPHDPPNSATSPLPIGHPPAPASHLPPLMGYPTPGGNVRQLLVLVCHLLHQLPKRSILMTLDDLGITHFSAFRNFKSCELEESGIKKDHKLSLISCLNQFELHLKTHQP